MINVFCKCNLVDDIDSDPRIKWCEKQLDDQDWYTEDDNGIIESNDFSIFLPNEEALTMFMLSFNVTKEVKYSCE